MDLYDVFIELFVNYEHVLLNYVLVRPSMQWINCELFLCFLVFLWEDSGRFVPMMLSGSAQILFDLITHAIVMFSPKSVI
jgi:hypothetical protein